LTLWLRFEVASPKLVRLRHAVTRGVALTVDS
jgi:hypothetical protein